MSDIDTDLTKPGPRLRYFLVCADVQNPLNREDQDHHGICNNSDHKYVHTYLQPFGETWQTYLQTYLRAKFAYLAALAHEHSMPFAELAAVLDLPPESETLTDGIEEIAKFWRDIAATENRALLLRLQQLPDDVVVENWYFDCPEFRKWADAIIEQHASTLSRTWREVYRDDYTALIDDQESDNIEQRQAVADAIHSHLTAVVNRLSAHLSGIWPDPPGLEIQFVDGVLSLRSEKSEAPLSTYDLISPIATYLFQRGNRTEPMQLLTDFLDALVRAVDCEYCDFLIWKADVDLLSPIAATESEKFARLKDEPYGPGEGITGSVMLMRAHNLTRFVGTNNYRNDPRGSKKHGDKWEKDMGSRISDYWVVPVFSGSGRPFGAFRIVNRTPARWVAGIPWPRQVLMELQALAIWFENELLPTVASLGTESVVASHQVDPTHTTAVQTLRSACGLDWLDADLLAATISHICSVAFRKVEKNPLGCSIGIFPGEKGSRLTNVLAAYRAVGTVGDRDLDTISELYPQVNPSAGMFVFSTNGRCTTVVSLSGKFGSGIDSMKNLTSKRQYGGVVFLLERGRKSIRIVSGGRIVADYDMSEVTGKWTLRVYDSLVKQIRAEAPAGFSHDMVEEIFRLAADLSYERVGSTIILTDDIPNTISLESGEERSNLLLESLTKPSEFIDLARIDGAMQVNRSGDIVRCGMIIRPNMSITRHGGDSQSLAEEVADVANDSETLRHGRPGSRHGSAKLFVNLAKDAGIDALAIVVSENGPISVFRGHDVVLYRQ